MRVGTAAETMGAGGVGTLGETPLGEHICEFHANVVSFFAHVFAWFLAFACVYCLCSWVCKRSVISEQELRCTEKADPSRLSIAMKVQRYGRFDCVLI